MSAPRSEFLRLRGLRFHVRRLGAADRPWLFVLHGWSDTARTFEPMLAPLAEHWQIVVPDLRGFGHSQWSGDTYWFPDYVADVDALVAHYCGSEPLRLVGHSMGAQIASLYAGLRPERVKRLALLDGLFMQDMSMDSAAKRYRGWLDSLARPPEVKRYASAEAFAAIIGRLYPRLSGPRAEWVSRRWSRPDAGGGVTVLADPIHRMNTPLPYQLEHSRVIWREVRAPTLLIDGAQSPFVLATPTDLRQSTLDCFADHRHEVVADAGHMLHLDAPETTAALLREFLA
ncbi:MAG: alpha/beta hydrolase [Pseudomonadota bacterium]|nr:alpha/beta hydrolase [Pseudomonadota bacterium]